MLWRNSLRQKTLKEVVFDVTLCYRMGIDHHIYSAYMFKKNPGRPDMVVSLKKVSGGYKLQPSESHCLFQVKKVTRTMYRPDLIQAAMGDSQGLQNSSTIIQPPSHLTLPAFASWFDLNSIHPIEERFFPQFFTFNTPQSFSLNRKNPRLYRFLRDSMVLMWRQNIKKYLSSAQCRRNLPGDVSSIVRIHGFLESWGLINFPSKEHSRGITKQTAQKLSCYVCQNKESEVYHVAQIQDVIFQICNQCFTCQLYPASILPEEFVQVHKSQYDQNHRKKMSIEQCCRMLEILGPAGSSKDKEKEAWNAVQKQFPTFTREDLVFNFLRVPMTYQMNSSVLENNEQITEQGDPSCTEQAPTIMEDSNNPLQASIAASYAQWKQNQERNPLLSQLFAAAQRQALRLASQQEQKISELTKMMVEVQYSKLQLKTLFIQEYSSLVEKTKNSQRRLAANTMAQALKLNIRAIERQEQPEELLHNGQN